MARPIVTYNCYDIVKVPFPFTDRQASKHRPALIISMAEPFNNQIEYSVMVACQEVSLATGFTNKRLRQCWAADEINNPFKTIYFRSPINCQYSGSTAYTQSNYL